MVLAAASIASFLLFLYPFIIYPRLLAALPKQPLARPQDGTDVSFTLVFCAYNEEQALPEKLANLRALVARYPNLEILAYSDMSSDRTLEMLQAESDILTAVAATDRLGKAFRSRYNRRVTTTTTGALPPIDAALSSVRQRSSSGGLAPVGL